MNSPDGMVSNDKLPPFRQVWVLFWLVALTAFFLDQGSKYLALQWLVPHRPVNLVPGLFNLTLTFNPGAAFSLLPGARWLFVVVSFLAFIFLPMYLKSLLRAGDSHQLHALSLGLILGGAMGNACDRLFRPAGLVVDFFHAFWRDYHFPVFNVADSAISVGITLLFLNLIYQTWWHRSSVESQTSTGSSESG